MSKVDDVITAAERELGRPYVYGAEGPNTFDCSGLMQFVFSQVGISLPRTAAQQQAATTRVSSPMPGDLVFWGSPAYHVALYIGGGKIIAAPHSGTVVQIQDVWGKPSGYGRVKGLGTALAPAVGVTTAAVSTASNVFTDMAGTLKASLTELVFVLLGGGLVAYGAYAAVVPRGQRKPDLKELL